MIVVGRAVTVVATASAVAWLAWANGGYFPSEWGIGIVAAGLLCLGAVVIRDRIEVSRRDVVLVGAVAALAGWAALSALWTTADGPALSEAERGLLYAASIAAILLTLDAGRVPALLGGIVAGATLVVTYGLATRLFPGDVGGAYDPSSGYQLAEPLGYWNALGALAALALLLALGLARTGGHATRIAAGASLVPLAAALYFTFSRGSLVALAFGFAALIAVERDRIRALVECAGLALAPAFAVWLCSGNAALTAPGATLQTAQAQGHRLAWQLVLVSAIAGGVAFGLPRLTRSFRLGRGARRVVVAVAAGGALLVLLGGLVAVGGPGDAVTRLSESFRAQPDETEGDLNRRLLSVSGHGRADYWRVTLEMTGEAPLAGTGAGTFERNWLEKREVRTMPGRAGLYLETLGELGVVGLAIVLVILATPFTALRVARDHPLAASASARSRCSSSTPPSTGTGRCPR